MPNPEHTTPTVVIYVRTARYEAADRTQARVAALRARAHERGWTVTAVIAETRAWGISEQMLEALTSYDIVLTPDASRLSRNSVRVLEIMQRLRAAGVRVVSGDGGECSGGEEMLELILLLQAGAAREDHSRRVKAGIAAARARREAQR